MPPNYECDNQDANALKYPGFRASLPTENKLGRIHSQSRQAQVQCTPCDPKSLEVKRRTTIRLHHYPSNRSSTKHVKFSQSFPLRTNHSIAFILSPTEGEGERSNG
ncbi:hypothetical protein AAHE18_01G116500 [Arachis hypogaea]